ncbi:MAG: SDR family NAD(P)-dependent oxidoreductase [Fimbriimonadaceae bacterium]
MTNLLSLRGKHVCVVGGSRGIGAAAVRMAAQAGAAVSFTYRAHQTAAAAIEAEVKAAGGTVRSLPAEVADEGSIDAALDDFVHDIGPLWGVVVSAGIFEGCPLEDMTAEFWDRTMAINVRGTFLAVRAAASHINSTRNGGSIVIYTSTAGQRGSANYSAYAASKAAQIMFMRSMAKELAPGGIRVNCIAPAWTDTDMVAADLDALGREAVAAGFPLGRIGRPDDVAGATCFLLSDLASFITGSTVTVDGGMDMRG